MSSGHAALLNSEASLKIPKSESHRMLQWRNNSASAIALAQATAISKSQAVIECEMDGKIITANQNFLAR